MRNGKPLFFSMPTVSNTMLSYRRRTMSPSRSRARRVLTRPLTGVFTKRITSDVFDMNSGLTPWRCASIQIYYPDHQYCTNSYTVQATNRRPIFTDGGYFCHDFFNMLLHVVRVQLSFRAQGAPLKNRQYYFKGALSNNNTQPSVKGSRKASRITMRQPGCRNILRY
jgi:hypothetical protein